MLLMFGSFSAFSQSGVTTLGSFGSNNWPGYMASAGLHQGPDNRLYGTTYDGGASNVGVIFAVNPNGSAYTVLHSFNYAGVDGYRPVNGVLVGSDGKLYGTCEYGGTNGSGTLFRLNTDGTGYQILRHFAPSNSNVIEPRNLPIEASDGRLYFPTQRGGSTNFGMVVSCERDGSDFRVIHDFGGFAKDGYGPLASLIEGVDGMLYGTCYSGGSNGFGTAFRLRRDGSDYTNIHHFASAATNGANSYAGLMQGSDGGIYGATYRGGAQFQGALFRMNPDGSGFAILHSFNPGVDGGSPYVPPTEGSDSMLYGTTTLGGTANAGIIYRCRKDGGGYSVVYTFSNTGTNGYSPHAILLPATDGAFYSTALSGGAEGGGTLYRFIPPCVAPAIVTSPQSQAVECGSTATFSVAAAGTPPCYYRWQRSNTNLPGTDTNQLSAGVAGTYRVIVTNACGAATSSPVTLTITDGTPPSITCSSNRVVRCQQLGGAIVTFSASASDNCDASPAVACTPPSGNLFPIGTTVVHCTARDSVSRSNACAFTVTVLTAAPVAEWQRSFGGSDHEQITRIRPVTGGGYVVVGNSYSIPSGNKTSPSFGSDDGWILRLDANGNKVWEHSYGGTYSDGFEDILQTADGGFLVLGESGSPEQTGNKTAPSYGGYDCWVLKLDSSGNKLWERTYGGSGHDLGLRIFQTANGDALIAANTSSVADGNKSSPSYGQNDFWVLRIDSNGNKLWDKSFGGSGSEYLNAADITSDGGLIIGGESDSGMDGNKTTPAFGSYDYYVVRLDSTGSKLWERTLGGTSSDYLHGLRQTSGGDFILAGNSGSGATGNKSSAEIGLWVLRLDSSGTTISEHSIPDPNDGQVLGMELHPDGGFYLFGQTYSGFTYKAWLLRATALGQPLWTSVLGGTGGGGDNWSSLVQNSDGTLVVAGGSGSYSNEFKTSPAFGYRDFWIVKLRPENEVLLRITPQNGFLILEWPISCSSDVLEESPLLGPLATWNPVSAMVQVVGPNYRVTIALPVAPRYYRTRRG